MLISLTINDLLPNEFSKGIQNPYYIDFIRESLIEAGVKHCVAFIFGSNVKRYRPQLSRWLKDGFELGNFTQRDFSSSSLSIDQCIEDIDKCDQLLAEIGAFNENRTKWLRFPKAYLINNKNTQLELDERIKNMGFSIVNASFDFYDYLYDPRIEQALEKNDDYLASRIGSRFRECVFRNIAFSNKWAQNKGTHERQRVLVACCRFGVTSFHQLPSIFDELNKKNVVWQSLSDVTADDKYYLDDQKHTPFPFKIIKTISKKNRWLDVINSSQTLGPKWPFV